MINISIPQYLNIKSSQNGFSVVEMLITTFVFSIISIVITTIFTDVLDLQRRGFAAQAIQEETLFVLESMAREIRVSQISGPDDLNCSLISLTIDHPVNGPMTYFLSSGMINKTVGGNTFPITSSKINFSRLNFCVMSTGIDNEQPRVTVITSVQTTSGQDGLKFDVQTTVSSRDMSEEFLN